MSTRLENHPFGDRNQLLSHEQITSLLESVAEMTFSVYWSVGQGKAEIQFLVIFN